MKGLATVGCSDNCKHQDWPCKYMILVLALGINLYMAGNRAIFDSTPASEMLTVLNHQNHAICLQQRGLACVLQAVGSAGPTRALSSLFTMTEPLEPKERSSRSWQENTGLDALPR